MQVGASHLPPLSHRFSLDCPGCEVFRAITAQWSLLILLALRDGELRFHMLRDQVEGISERMLSKNLKELVSFGLISRRVKPTVPPQVSYALTPIGQELAVVMMGVSDWIERRLPEIEEARARAGQD